MAADSSKFQTFLEAGIGIVTDSEVARRLGVTRQCVHQQRVQRNMPAPSELDPVMREKDVDEVPEIVAALQAKAEDASLPSVARALGVPYHTVVTHAKRHGIKGHTADNRSELRRKWEEADWTQSNVTLAKQWKTTVHAVAMLRMRLRRLHGEKRVPYLQHRPGGEP